MRVSPSALERYRRCPRSFLLIDIERHRRREAPSGPLVMGSAVHAALERFYGLPASQRTPDAVERALRHVWPRCRVEGAFINRGEEALYGHRALEMLRRHVESSSVDADVVARECWVEARLNPTLVAFGKVDRVDRLTSGGLRVVDYKTGRLDLDAQEMAGESSVQAYVVGVERTFAAAVEVVSFVYLDHGVEVRWDPEREDVEALGERLVELARTIAADEAFEPMPGLQCDYCSVALRCPARLAVAIDDLTTDGTCPF